MNMHVTANASAIIKDAADAELLNLDRELAIFLAELEWLDRLPVEIDKSWIEQKCEAADNRILELRDSIWKARATTLAGVQVKARAALSLAEGDEDQAVVTHLAKAILALGGN